MKTIEEMSFTVNKGKCTYKLYEYEEQVIRKTKISNGEYIDKKVNVTKYALHQEYEINGKFKEKLVCETELYATILSIFRDILTEYVEMINKWKEVNV